MKFETLQSESPVTWLNEVLVLLSVALHRAQQLRDKVGFHASDDVARITTQHFSSVGLGLFTVSNSKSFWRPINTATTFLIKHLEFLLWFYQWIYFLFYCSL